MQRERYWVSDKGICQVCMGDRWRHCISSQDGVYWCEVTSINGEEVE